MMSTRMADCETTPGERRRSFAAKQAAAAAAAEKKKRTNSALMSHHLSNALAIIVVIVPLSQLITGAISQSVAVHHTTLASVAPASHFELSNGAGQLGEPVQVAGDEHPNELGSAGGGRRNWPPPPPPPQQVSHKSPLNGRQFGDTINDIQIECNSNNIVVTLQTNSGFNGMIYPKGLSKNSTCMTEYHQLASNITYYLPLKSCNTMSTDVEDGVEYFNTVMVQPHRRLVTNQGRGYHIRCRYQTKERTITNQEQQLSVNLSQVTPAVMGSASMPSCSMRIYSTADLQHEVSAENVRIGDELQLVISLDEQDVYGLLVTNCLVRDGMNWGEQPLIDDRGCPVDDEIMPEFVYAANLTRASVTFQAHKFPYTSSVYYQCNVRLCFREAGCQAHVPPNCAPSRPGGQATQHYKSQAEAQGQGQGPGQNELEPEASSLAQQQKSQQAGPQSAHRHRRWVDGGQLDGVASDELLRPLGARHMSIEVSSGLHVAERDTSEASALDEPANGSPGVGADPLMAAATNDDPEAGAPADPETGATTGAADSAKERRQSEREFCMSLRRFAIIVSLISLLLMAAILILIACLIQRRNRRKLESQLSSTYEHHHHQHQDYPAQAPKSAQHYDGYAGAPYANRAYCRD